MLHGIDVSNNQGSIDWAQVAAATIEGEPVSFALMKRSQGTNFSDEYFPANWAGAKAHGLWRAAYQFAVPTANTPEAEASYLLSQLTLETYDGAALDYEPADAYWQLHPDDWMLRFCQRIEAAAGVVPLIYTTKSIAAVVTNPALARYPLWLVCLEDTLPASIGVWPSVALWQHSWTGRVAGISGNVDLNKLERGLDGLRALGKPAPKPLVWTIKTDCDLKAQANHGPNTVTRFKAGAIVELDPPVTPHWQHVHTSHYSGWVLADNLEHN